MPLGDNAWDEATSGPCYKGLACRSVHSLIHGTAAGIEPSSRFLVRCSAARSGRGPSGQQQASGAPGKGEEQDGASGEDSQGAHGDRGSKCLRCSDTRGG
jgi:hypothetical protein